MRNFLIICAGATFGALAWWMYETKMLKKVQQEREDLQEKHDDLQEKVVRLQEDIDMVDSVADIVEDEIQAVKEATLKNLQGSLGWALHQGSWRRLR